MKPVITAAGSGFPNFADPFKSWVDDLSGRSYVRFSPTDVWQPDVNVYESGDAFLVCVDLAGMSPDAITVEAIDNKLVIRGTRTPPAPSDLPPGDVSVHLMEIDSGAFRREIEIRRAIRQNEIGARYADGLLWITLPKA